MEPNTNNPDPNEPIQPWSPPVAPPTPTPSISSPPPPPAGPISPSHQTQPDQFAAPPTQPTVVPPTVPQQPAAAPRFNEAPPTAVFGEPESTAPGTPVVGGPIDPLATSPAPRKRFSKSVLIILVILLVIGGGAAAAYMAIIVPNKPANVLKAALTNSLQQKQTSFKGNFEVDPANAGSTGGVSAKATFSGSVDTVKKANDVVLNFTVSGVDFSIEARLVDGNLYLKPGDLSTITGLVGSFSPDLAKTAQTLSDQLSNKWIVVDSTLLKEAGADCALNTNWSLSKTDVKLLESQYDKHPFATIQSSGSDTVDGKKAEKIVLSLDDDKMAAYTKNLNQLSLVKSLQACQKGSSTSDASSSLANHDHTPLTIWVDKGSKQIVQIASRSTAQDAKKDTLKGSVTLTLNYHPVSISAPTGAKPALQVLTDLQASLGNSGLDLSNLFGGTGTGGTGSGTLLQ